MRLRIIGLAGLSVVMAACSPSAPGTQRASREAVPPVESEAVSAPTSPSAAADETPSPPEADTTQRPDKTAEDDHAEFVAKINAPATETGAYGAIAVATDGSIVYAGLSYGARNREVAEKVAIQICSAALEEKGVTPGSPCASQVWFYNKCGGLATSKTGGWGTGYGDSGAQACAWAQKTCAQYGAGCEPGLYICSPSGKNGTCDGKLTQY